MECEGVVTPRVTFREDIRPVYGLSTHQDAPDGNEPAPGLVNLPISQRNNIPARTKREDAAEG